MPHKLGLKIALEHTRTTKLSWRFLILFYNVIVVCLKTITFANQAKFVTKNNVSFNSHKVKFTHSSFCWNIICTLCVLPFCIVSVLSVQLHLGVSVHGCCILSLRSWVEYRHSIVNVMVKTAPHVFSIPARHLCSIYCRQNCISRVPLLMVLRGSCA